MKLEHPSSLSPTEILRVSVYLPSLPFSLVEGGNVTSVARTYPGLDPFPSSTLYFTLSVQTINVTRPIYLITDHRQILNLYWSFRTLNKMQRRSLCLHFRVTYEINMRYPGRKVVSSV